MARLVVQVMPAALEDLDKVLEFVREQSPQGAERFADAFFDSLALLADFPERCAIAPESEEWGYVVRSLLVFSHRVLYTVGKNKVSVLRIVHGAMNLPSDFV